jgi:hypothetical protein
VHPRAGPGPCLTPASPLPPTLSPVPLCSVGKARTTLFSVIPQHLDVRRGREHGDAHREDGPRVDVHVAGINISTEYYMAEI